MEHKLSSAQMQKFIAVVNEVERYRDLSEKEKEGIVLSIIGRPYMDLRSDWAFKHVLQDKEILKMLLNDFLPEEIDSVELQPNEIDRLRPDDKNVIMDVLCRTVDGRKFIVEMQRKKKRSFQRRMLYYGASMLHRQLRPNQPYSALRPVYVICFMDFRLPHETDQLVYRYSLCEQESGERYGDLLSIYLCELPRLKATSIEGLDPVRSWFYILENMRTFAGKPEEMGKRYAAVAEAARMYTLPDEQIIQYLRNMITEEERLDMGGAYYDDGFADGKQAGLEEGRKEGMEKGREEEKKSIAEKLHGMGMPLESIALATGLPVEELKGIF